jgi:hypothetical protein
VSSLWTPEGEHRVPRQPIDPSPPGGEIVTPGADDYDEHDAAERERIAAEMAELERELAEAPVEEVIANHCYGLFQLAALHLGQRPPRLEEARLAIDAFAGIVEGLGDRLGPAADTLREGLAQIRLAFVQISTVQAGAGASDPTTSG